MFMRQGVHRTEIVYADGDGVTEILASEEIESSLREAKRRCEQMAKTSLIRRLSTAAEALCICLTAADTRKH